MQISFVFVFLRRRPITLIKYEYVLVRTDPDVSVQEKSGFMSPPPPLKSNNQLPDQLAFSVKSHAVCSEPGLRIIEGDNCCLAVVWSRSLTDWLPLIHTHTWTVITNEHIKTHKEWVTLIINTHATHALVFLVPFRGARVHPSQNNPSPSCRHSALSLRLSHSLITL